jgi:flagellar biosynthesis/type III secretory pathway chaperone
MQSLTRSYDNLITILEKEFDLLVGVVELLQKEKDVITSNNLDNLNNHVREKETVFARIRACEDVRTRELKSLGLSKSKLSEIAETAGPESKERLALIVSKLKSVSGSITELNKLNGLLIEKSLFYIRNSRRFLETFGITPKGKVSVEV